MNYNLNAFSLLNPFREQENISKFKKIGNNGNLKNNNWKK